MTLERRPSVPWAVVRQKAPGFYPQSVIDCLPCYITIQNRDLKIIYANQTFLNDFADGVRKTGHFVYKGCLDRCKICPVQETFNDKKYHISKETVQTLDDNLKPWYH